MRIIIFAIPLFFLVGCSPAYKSTKSESTTVCGADYTFSFAKVDRPEKASQRYGVQRIETMTLGKSTWFVFEDGLVRIRWIVSGSQISFSVLNKTDHSIKIPWDEAAYIDENGSSHRVMHSGAKYTKRQQPQAPSLIGRKASIEDFVFPTDYVYWKEGRQDSSGEWREHSLLPWIEFVHQSGYLTSDFSSFEAFDVAAKSKVGKSIQVLLPFQIDDVMNEYIFSFKVESVSTKKEVW